MDNVRNRFIGAVYENEKIEGVLKQLRTDLRKVETSIRKTASCK